MNLPSDKSPGPNGWPIQLIKLVGEFIAAPLSILFNKSFNSDILPQVYMKVCSRNTNS